MQICTSQFYNYTFQKVLYIIIERFQDLYLLIYFYYISSGRVSKPGQFMPRVKATNKIYVTGLSAPVTVQDIASFFGSIGMVKNDQSGKPLIGIYQNTGSATVIYKG